MIVEQRSQQQVFAHGSVSVDLRYWQSGNHWKCREAIGSRGTVQLSRRLVRRPQAATAGARPRRARRGRDGLTTTQRYAKLSDNLLRAEAELVMGNAVGTFGPRAGWRRSPQNAGSRRYPVVLLDAGSVAAVARHGSSRREYSSTVRSCDPAITSSPRLAAQRSHKRRAGSGSRAGGKGLRAAADKPPLPFDGLANS